MFRMPLIDQNGLFLSNIPDESQHETVISYELHALDVKTHAQEIGRALPLLLLFGYNLHRLSFPKYQQQSMPQMAWQSDLIYATILKNQILPMRVNDCICPDRSFFWYGTMSVRLYSVVVAFNCLQVIS